MIVSGIWWKRADASLKVLSLTSALLLLGGCGLDQLLLGRPSAPPPPEPLPPVRPSPAQPEAGAGLAPLLTPQQVLTSVPFGRRDPFAALPAPAVATANGASSQTVGGAAGGRPGSAAGASASSAVVPGGDRAASSLARLVPPEGFRLTGVIRSGASAEALVSYGPASGSLRQGDRGGRSTDLLPPGWAVASIQFGGRTLDDSPSITLQRGRQTVPVKLR